MSNKIVDKKSKDVKKIEEMDLGTKEWEDAILFPLKIMKILLIIYCCTALLLPIYKDTGFFIDSFSTVLAILVLSVGVLERYGRGFDISPIFTVTLVRVVHILVNFFFMKHPINYIFYFLLIFIEIVLSVVILVDNTKYECVRERKS